MNGIEFHEGTCERIVDHESRLGALEKGSVILETQVSTLFKEIKVAFEATGDVGRKVDKVQYSLENGISRDIKELCELARRQQHTIEQNRVERQDMMKSLDDRIKPLEETSWIPKLLNTGIHKVAAYLFLILLLIALAQTAMWSLTKTYVFQEAPGQSTRQFNTLDKGHSHEEIKP